MTVAARVVLFSKPDCPLCEEATAMLEAMGVTFEPAADPAYADRVPVITVDGAIVTEGRVSERAVRRALRRAR
ncbi:MAG TPA: glutaredoxin family protein [Actinomycetota bacterium]